MKAIIDQFMFEIILTSLILLLTVGVVGFTWIIVKVGNIAEDIHRHLQTDNHCQSQMIIGISSTQRQMIEDFNKRFTAIESTARNIDGKLEVIFVNTKVEKSKQLTQEELQQAVKELSGLIESARTNLAKNVFSVHEAVTQLDKSVASTFIKSLTGTGKS